MAISRPLVVYKLGGSLLDLPDLPGLVGQVVAQRPGQAALIVVGGGAAADIVRRWDSTHGLGEETSHALALKAVTFNESFLKRLMPELRPVRNLPQLEAAANQGACALLCAGCYLRWAEAHANRRLPHTWQVTTDSIAALAAQMAGAAELVLIKSTGVSDGITASDAAASGLVDPFFPELAPGLPRIGWVHARSASLEITPWIMHEGSFRDEGSSRKSDSTDHGASISA